MKRFLVPEDVRSLSFPSHGSNVWPSVPESTRPTREFPNMKNYWGWGNAYLIPPFGVLFCRFTIGKLPQKAVLDMHSPPPHHIKEKKKKGSPTSENKGRHECL